MAQQLVNNALNSLTADAVIVLFEFLQRYSKTDELAVEDQAEQRAL